MIQMPTDAEPVVAIEGDCREVIPTLPPGSFDAIVTDPPYLTGESGITYEHTGVAERTAPTTTVGMPWGYDLDWVDICAAHEPKHWVVFCHYLMLADVTKAIEKHAKLSAVFAWRKSNAPNMARPVPRLDCEFIVWARHKRATCGRMNEFRSLVLDVPMLQAGCMAGERLLKPGTGQALHPCQKPLAVVRPFVRRLGCDRFLDPFAGTGTLGVACISEGKRAVLIERDPEYVDVIHRQITDAMCKQPGSLFADTP